MTRSSTSEPSWCSGAYDDSATSFDAVIAAHGGEASNSRDAYLAA